MGGTMRLGADPVKLHDGTRAREIYGEAVIYERHRHRYEVNNHLRKRLEHAGLVFSGTSPDDRLVEVVELPDHPFFVASQFHPEFKSRPLRPQPLFREFVGAALARATGRAPEVEPDVARRVPRLAVRRHRLAERSEPMRARSLRCAPPTRRQPAERTQLLGDFVRLCEIESPSRRERAIADALTRRPARARARGRGGRQRRRDRLGRRQPARAHPRAGGRAHDPALRAPGHRAARRAGRGGARGRRVLATATRRSSAPTTRPRWRRDGRGAAAGRGGLARSASSCCSPPARSWRSPAPRRSTPAGCAREFGFVFDHASPIGELIVAAPTYYRLEARFHGAAAHAGIRPEDGRNAIVAAAARWRRCRSAASTTRPPPTSAASRAAPPPTWCAERCLVELEARSLDDDARRRAGRRAGRRARRGRQRRRVRRRDLGRAAVPRLPAAAHRAARARSPSGALEAAASSRCRSPPAAAATPTPSSPAGCRCVNVANGTERNHQPDESVTVDALETMLDVTLALVAASAG